MADSVCIDGISNLRKSIVNSSVIPKELPDEILTRFLKACDYEVEECSKVLTNYFKLFTSNRELFMKTKDYLDRYGQDGGMYLFLPKRLDTGQVAIVCRVSNWNPKKEKLRQAFSSFIPFLESSTRKSLENGFICLIDMRNFAWSTLTHIKPSDIQFCVDLIEHTFPFVLHKIHVLYESRVVSVLFNLIKPWLSDNLKAKIVFHGKDMTKFYDVIERDYLPVDLGGHLEYYHFTPERIHRMDNKLEELYASYQM
ncbi:Retinaldehyde-binding protein 1 [Halotydeus destructor]|nr:Retinaldehyde-binding protein 1 [Halotydeus destructor]